jgi:hypothetical protein
MTKFTVQDIIKEMLRNRLGEGMSTQNGYDGHPGFAR